MMLCKGSRFDASSFTNMSSGNAAGAHPFMKEGSTLSRALCVTRNSQGYNCIADIDTLGCECDLQGTRDHHTGVFDVRSSSAWLTAALQVAECTGTTGLQIMEQRWAPGKTAGVRHKHGTHGTKFSKLKKPHSLMFHTAFWTALSVSHVNLGTPVETEINGPGREASSLQVFDVQSVFFASCLSRRMRRGPGCRAEQRPGCKGWEESSSAGSVPGSFGPGNPRTAC